MKEWFLYSDLNRNNIIIAYNLFLVPDLLMNTSLFEKLVPPYSSALNFDVVSGLLINYAQSSAHRVHCKAAKELGDERSAEQCEANYSKMELSQPYT